MYNRDTTPNTTSTHNGTISLVLNAMVYSLMAMNHTQISAVNPKTIFRLLLIL